VNSADFAEIVSVTREFVRDRVVPAEDLIEENDEVPSDIRQSAKEIGLYGFAIPVEYGGLGLNLEEEVQLVFELGYTAPALRSMFGTNNGIAGHVLLEGGTEEQKKEWLPKLASGELTASFALTETEAGSDPSTLTTRAERNGDTWVLNGSKRYVTNAPIADVFMVFARTNPAAKATRGISAFLVPRSAPGLTVGPKDRKMGQFGAWTSEVFLEDVPVDIPALIGGAMVSTTGMRSRCVALPTGAPT
jgi:acyl-CoA dehydrogenase